MDAASIWLSRQITKKISEDEQILTRTLASGGVQDQYQFICGQISALQKIAQWIKDADPDERPKFQEVGNGYKQQVY